MVPSNVAKKLLEEFVEKHGDQVEVVYTLSGWLKSNPSNYHIRLVSQSKLAEAKEEFEENCSLQVYSVQTYLPKDPAVLWNAEFIQAEELFKQPAAVDNCLRDNRFCGVSNSTVKRNVGGIHATPTSELKSTGVLGQFKKTSVQQTSTLVDSPQKKAQQSGPSSSMQSIGSAKVVKTDNNSIGAHEQNSKPAEDKRNIPQLPVNRKKSQNDKNPSWTENELSNMWDRASAKPKGHWAASKANDNLPNSADAQICAGGEVQHDNSDDDITVKRAPKSEATRKRRVVFDDSDEEDDFKEVITPATPDLSKMDAMLSSKQRSNSSDLEKKNLRLDELKEDVANVKDKRGAETNQVLKEEPSAPTKVTNSSISSQYGSVDHVSAVHTNLTHKRTDTAPVSPKRRKVVKTMIDERGREVTEVFWEGEEIQETPGSQTTTKADNSRTHASNRLSVKKSPAVGNNAPVNQGSKGGKKKGGKIDPKQGNILSFFKKI